MTKREQEVLESLIRGKTNKAIAIELKISEYTVRDHISSLFRQLNVSTRSQLTARAFMARQALLTISSDDNPLPKNKCEFPRE